MGGRLTRPRSRPAETSAITGLTGHDDPGGAMALAIFLNFVPYGTAGRPREVQSPVTSGIDFALPHRKQRGNCHEAFSHRRLVRTCPGSLHASRLERAPPSHRRTGSHASRARRVGTPAPPS